MVTLNYLLILWKIMALSQDVSGEVFGWLPYGIILSWNVRLTPSRGVSHAITF